MLSVFKVYFCSNKCEILLFVIEPKCLIILFFYLVLILYIVDDI